MNTIEKDRNLTTFQFFEQLQLEYIVAELRGKIYPKVKDKEYWRKIMKFKREKIEDISFKNALPSIFSDPKYKIDMYLKIYKERGLPTFLYRNEKQRISLEEQDKINYFLSTSEVKVFRDNKISIGYIKQVNLEADLVEVEVSNEILVVSINDVGRVL